MPGSTFDRLLAAGLRELANAGAKYATPEQVAALADVLPHVTAYAQKVVVAESGFGVAPSGSAARVVSLREVFDNRAQRLVPHANRMAGRMRRRGFGVDAAIVLGAGAAQRMLANLAAAWYQPDEVTYVAEAILGHERPQLRFLELALHEEFHRAQAAARNRWQAERPVRYRHRLRDRLRWQRPNLQRYLTEAHPVEFTTWQLRDGHQHWLPPIPELGPECAMPVSSASAEWLAPYLDGPEFLAAVRAEANGDEQLRQRYGADGEDIIVAATRASVPIRRGDLRTPLNYVRRISTWR